MSRSVSARNKRGPDRNRAGIPIFLKTVERSQKLGERAFRQRLIGQGLFPCGKRFQPFSFEDSLRLIGKQHRVAIESDPYLMDLLLRIVPFGMIGHDRCGRYPAVNGSLCVRRIRRKKKIDVESFQIRGQSGT